jgi:DNA-binding transcriptional LysR family regulator
MFKMLQVHHMHLLSIDLNLLVVLRALLETQSVKQAAVRVSLSPSATSHALARLRDLFDDALLVRAGRGLVLTPRAARLRPVLVQWLGDAETLLADTGAFLPAAARRRFVLGTNDYTERVVLVPLSGRVAASAPGVDLLSRHAGDAQLGLRAGTVDLVVGASRSWPGDIEHEDLYEERHVCLLRRGHPAARGLLTAERYAGLSHVLVAPGGSPTSHIDRRLAALGLSRRVARTVGTFSVAPHLLIDSDLVLMLAERLALPAARELGLVVVEAPFAVRFPISMAWHRRTSGDPAQAWLRAEVRAAVAGTGWSELGGSEPP